MTESWAFSGEPASLDVSGPAQTLVEGSTFCTCAAGGDIVEGGSYGLFFRDMRSLSRWELRVNGQRPQLLSAYRTTPFSARFVSRVPPEPGRADSHLLVTRDRLLGDGMREDLVIRNLGAETAVCTVTVLVDVDFADLFEVKENRTVHRPERLSTTARDDLGGLRHSYRWLGQSRDVLVTSDQLPSVSAGVLTFTSAVPPRGAWSTVLQVRFSIDGTDVSPGYHDSHQPELARPARKVAAWARRAPALSTPHAPLLSAWRTGQEDLGSLRIGISEGSELEAVAAGAPWFMTVFGRDSLLASWMALPLDPGLALGTLTTLARHQGTREDPLTEEQPGRILHEMRFGAQSGQALGGGSAYYGSVDSSALFVMLLGEAHDWGLGRQQLLELLPHADAALQWIDQHGDRDGDGFVEYQRATDGGLLNQGWKDSFDGINDLQGALARTPIALCEVQAYSYGAFRARARIAVALGDARTAAAWDDRAAGLKAAFNDAFWLEDKGWFAVALDRDKRPVDALTSNIGHCLWTGIVEDDKARSVADHLLSADMFSGWGVRTLASSMGAYNPLSYHNGSVWPHDSAIAVAGLMRYGFTEHAHAVTLGLLDSGAAFHGRLPELWSGFDRSEFPGPLPYPTSCSPQAWAAASPFLLLRSLLGLHPQLPAGRLALSPRLPEAFLPLSVDNLRIGEHQLSLRVDRDGWQVTGLPEHVHLVDRP